MYKGNKPFGTLRKFTAITVITKTTAFTTYSAGMVENVENAAI